MIEGSGGVVHWVDAPGGVRVRVAHWEGSGRGTVLLLNGRTEFIEKYLEVVGELRGRGFAVWTMDWRGQGLSSRLLADGLTNHVGGFGDYLADLELVLDRLVLPGSPLVLVGHSMGGHLGARLLARRPGVFAAAVLIAPMMGFRSRLPAWVARWMISGACWWPGQVGRYGPGTSRLPPLDRGFEGNPLTHCPERYAAGLALVRGKVGLQVGGATWGWLRAAAVSMAGLERAGVVERITVPVLIAVAGEERFVDNDAIRRFAGRLGRGEVVAFPEGRHELLREEDGIRVRLWGAIDRLLTSVVP